MNATETRHGNLFAQPAIARTRINTFDFGCGQALHELQKVPFCTACMMTVQYKNDFHYDLSNFLDIRLISASCE
ncbi:MAG TPA: hypothetical protein VHK70_01480 [Burkholderiaceae bacterium]|nr:hypothetical protein [Burkholderiaceae bacterium]